MIKSKPQAIIMARKYQENKKIILAECMVSETAYNTRVYNVAIAWIRLNIWNDECMVSALTEQRDFWAWWLNQWNMREDAFIHQHLECIISHQDYADTLNPKWLLLHSPERINVQISQADCLQQAYSKIMATAFKTLNK